MRILDRYLLREFLVPLAACLCAFLLLMIIYDLFDNLSTFVKRGVPVRDVARYYGWLLPSNLTVIVPISLLLALLYCLALLSKHNELVAMRASGVSLRRLMLPYLGVGVLGSVGVFALNETLAPRALDRAERFMAETKLEYRQKRTESDRGDSPVPSDRALKLAKPRRVTGLFFYNGRDKRHWMIQEFDPARKLITNGVEILQLDASGQTELWKAVASWGRYLDGKWWFFDVRIIDLQTLQVLDASRQRIMSELNESPRLLASELKKPDQMTVKELRNYLSVHASRTELQLAPFRLNLHQRFAQPWMCLIMVLLAVSLGTRQGRRGPLASVAGSLALFLLYWFVSEVCYRLGESARLEPYFAAWSPNLLFGSAGLLGFSRVQ